MSVRIIEGDARSALPQLEPGAYRACVTSPPYWRQRRYGASSDEIGQEPTPEAWAASLVEVFGLVRPLLTGDGSLWLNVGDKYAAGGLGGGGYAASRKNWRGTIGRPEWRAAPPGYKPKDLTLAPFLLADALRQDGWYLRATIVWAKRAATEPRRLDRPSVSHEYLYLFSVAEASAVRDPGEPWFHSSVWQIGHDGDAAHIAKMPVELARRCIVAGTRRGDRIIDPFGGSGTSAIAADRTGRHATIVELYPESVALAQGMIARDAGPMLMTEVAVETPTQPALFDAERAS